MTWKVKGVSWLLGISLTVGGPGGRQLDARRHLARQSAPGCEAVPQALHLLQEYQQTQAIPGMQVAASLRGQMLLSEGLGYADVARQLPVTTTTRFRVGSVSKSLTSVALVQLAATHRLELDAPVQRYVPGFPASGSPITARALAGHLAGIRHYRPGDGHDALRTEHYQTATQALAVFQNDPLVAEPGTRFFYSSFGWNLLGAVIEGASGEPFLHYMQRAVWQPLGMVYTSGDRADSVSSDRSRLYSKGSQLAIADDVSYKYPSGGMLSTAEDLVKYGNALLGKAFLTPAQKRLLFTSQATHDGRSTHYGMGWRLETTRSGHKLYWHDGVVNGGSASLLLYPDDDLVVAILANSRQGATLNAKAIGDLFLSCK
ncbi:serine hydrolase domain-containing protein [Hymenobacter baengnokdamensis]|uniref:serine hydrolase domain-containing protein n=1 Tax=Hymenobacter baengnokdamensis TaxID=2615203 RepID=UPI0012457D2F|nr:serine hydrolase domain-containing protein [Hymenobacter baengnokdamensis]